MKILKKLKKIKGDASFREFYRNKENKSIVEIIKILKDNRCKKGIFAGTIKKPNFSKLKLDFKGIYYISRIIRSSKLGDAAILKEIIKILKIEKINTLDSLKFSPELTLKKGHYSKTKPNRIDKIDIKKGVKVLAKLNKYNFSQGAVVRNKKVIAIEGKGGTDRMLKKFINYKFLRKGVLVKLPKKKQDLRLDLPAVCLKTLAQCKSAGLKGIVLKNKQNILLERNKCISFANKNKMFITVK